MPWVEELPYRQDGAELFAAVADRPWAAFLDSTAALGSGGRHDIIVADPIGTLITRGRLTEVRRGDRVELSPQDPFALLRDALGPTLPAQDGVPFFGGAVGWLGYDLGRRIERLPSRARAVGRVPDLAVGLYDWALVVDHAERRCLLAGTGDGSDARSRRAGLVATFRAPRPVELPGLRLSGPTRSDLSEADYARAFDRIQCLIQAGDCYQVNLAQRFSAAAVGDAWPAYQVLRRLNPAPFSAFLRTPQAQVASASPERFLSLRDGLVRTSPIKGTCARHADPARDAEQARALAASPKDRAENLMIVDLLRNDLGRVCAPGSIRVPELFAVQRLAHVHHLVSTVEGRLGPGEDACSLLRACFPGGSITGAPKIRAMEIIDALEPVRRGIYCGAIGYLGRDGAMDTNIAIRTLVFDGASAVHWAGGGIVADSVLAREYRELEDKAAPLQHLLASAAPTPSAGCS